MALMNYRYFVRGQWPGSANEKPAVTGAKFLQTLDLLSANDPLFSHWQINRNWKADEDEQPRLVSIDIARNRIEEIVESGVSRNGLGSPMPNYGYRVVAIAGARGPRRVTFAARTGNQSFELSFGERNLAADLSIVTYALFKAALLAINAVWDAQWSCAQALRNDVVEVPIALGHGIPAFRMDRAIQVPLDPTFPISIFHIPWVAYLSAVCAAGLTLGGDILTERTPNGGVLLSATTERLDPTNPEHVRCARILAETMIACTGSAS